MFYKKTLFIYKESVNYIIKKIIVYIIRMKSILERNKYVETT